MVHHDSIMIFVSAVKSKRNSYSFSLLPDIKEKSG